MATLKHMPVILVLALAASWTNADEEKLLPVIRQPLQLSCPAFSYDAIYDLENNVITSHPNVTTVSEITGTGCSAQGVLKIALASAATDPNRRRVLIDLNFSDPVGWVFNVGDSSTNNGYAGDAGTQRWDAEVHGVGTTFSGYLSDFGKSAITFNILNLYTTRLILIVGDGQILWRSNNNDLVNYYHNSTFFALNGQPDPDGPANYDLYLGLNRVIYYTSRSGTGLCKVGIKFLKEY